GGVGATDQRLGQAVRVVGVIETVATLHAQTLLVGRTVTTLDVEDLVVLDVVGQLTADAAERADRVDLLVRHGHGHVARGHQRAGRTGLHALAAGHAGGRAHGIVHVEHDLGVRTA